MGQITSARRSPWRCPRQQKLGRHRARLRCLESKLDSLALLWTTRRTRGECCAFVLTETWFHSGLGHPSNRKGDPWGHGDHSILPGNLQPECLLLLFTSLGAQVATTRVRQTNPGSLLVGSSWHFCGVRVQIPPRIHSSTSVQSQPAPSWPRGGDTTTSLRMLRRQRRLLWTSEEPAAKASAWQRAHPPAGPADWRTALSTRLSPCRSLSLDRIPLWTRSHTSTFSTPLEPFRDADRPSGPSCVTSEKCCWTKVLCWLTSACEDSGTETQTHRNLVRPTAIYC